MATELPFNPFVTPKLIFRYCTLLGMGFALPYLTIKFTADGRRTYATMFTEAGKSTNYDFETSPTINGFIASLKEIGYDADKYFKL